MLEHSSALEMLLPLLSIERVIELLLFRRMGEEPVEKLSSLDYEVVEVNVIADSWDDLVWDLALSKLFDLVSART